MAAHAKIVQPAESNRPFWCNRSCHISAATCNQQFKSLASSAKKVKVKVPIQEKIEGQSVMQRLLLVSIPLKIGNDSAAAKYQISGETDPELHLRTLPCHITFQTLT